MNTSLTITDQRVDKVNDYESQVVSFFNDILSSLEKIESGELREAEIKLDPMDARVLGKYAVELYKEYQNKVDTKIGRMVFANTCSSHWSASKKSVTVKTKVTLGTRQTAPPMSLSFSPRAQLRGY